MKLPSVADVGCIFLLCCEGEQRLVEVALAAHTQLTEICIWIFLALNAFCGKGYSTGVSAVCQYTVKDWGNLISCVVCRQTLVHANGNSLDRCVRMPFSNGASWLPRCLLLGSSLPSCFGRLICLADVLLVTLCVLSVHQSADESLRIQRSCYGPLLGVRRLIFLTANWVLDDCEQLLFFLLS